MIINEVTSPVPSDLKNNIALMTKEEFLQFRNKSGKNHPSDAYQSNVKQFNRSHNRNYFYRDNGIEVNIYKHDDGYYVIEQDNRKVGVYHNDTLYYTMHYDFKADISLSRQEPFVKPKNKVKIKYIENITKKLDKIVLRNMKRYPYTLKRFIVDNEQMTVRTENKYNKPNEGHTIAVMNSVGYIIGMASDEWGTTLIRVADEYKGKQLGVILGDIWYKLNPDYMSGGFTETGRYNAIKIWAKNVREFLQSGWYSELVKSGKISKEKVKEIIKDLPEHKNKSVDTSATKEEKPDILIYTDNEISITVYDKKFYEDYNDKYIYGHAFLRDTYKDDYFIFSIDYEPSYRKLTTMAIFQLAKNLNEKLYVADKPSDHLEIDDFEEIKIDGNYAYLKKDVIPLKDFSKIEKRYRKSVDPYGEGLNHLLEFAESKWK